MIFQPEAITEEVNEEEKESASEAEEEEEKKDGVPPMVEVVQDVKAKRLGEIRQLSSQQTVTEVKISDEKIVQLDAILD